MKKIKSIELNFDDGTNQKIKIKNENSFNCFTTYGTLTANSFLRKYVKPNGKEATVIISAPENISNELLKKCNQIIDDMINHTM